MSVKGMGELSKLETRVRKLLDQAIAAKMLEAGLIFKKVLYELTPVWSGDTLANYRWSVGSPSMEYNPFNQDIYWYDASLLSNADAAEALAERSFNKINWKKSPYQKVYLTNNTQYQQNPDGENYTFSDLEYGTLPQSRSYGGILEKAMLALQNRYRR